MIESGLAPKMTSTQPTLEMARHRHAAIENFLKFEQARKDR